LGKDEPHPVAPFTSFAQFLNHLVIDISLSVHETNEVSVSHGCAPACVAPHIVFAVDGSVSALHAKFFLDHFFHVENSRRASERCFSIVRHSFQRTLPIAETF